jgi:hypothetical protein
LQGYFIDILAPFVYQKIDYVDNQNKLGKIVGYLSSKQEDEEICKKRAVYNLPEDRPCLFIAMAFYRCGFSS